MLATIKKKPKKSNNIQAIKKPLTENSKNDKVKKVVRVKPEVSKKPKTGVKPEVKSEVMVIKKERKKKEPKEPVDARVIDVSYEEPTETPEDAQVELEEERDERISYLTGKGTQHPVHELIQELRNILINSGFNELENSFFVAEKDIFKQYDVNQNLVFDKIYHLAEYPRPAIELNQEQITQLSGIKSDINIEVLKSIFNDYRENKIENYQIFQRLMAELNLNCDQATNILKIIPELNEKQPKLTNVTLRSSITSSWFTTLAAIADKESLPIKIFSTGIWFKRGPKLDELRLYSHYGASCIITDENINISNGKVIAEEILNRLGFKEMEFKDNVENRNFNVTCDELGIYVDDVEIATCGLFSPEVLKKYGIELPTLYINFGLEHMVMVQKGFDDIRELMFPQFYKAWKLNDEEIGKSLQFILKPRTELGKTIAKNLVKICEKNSHTISPCEFTVWEGPVKVKKNKVQSIEPVELDKQLVVKVVKREKDAKLCGPAYLNEIVVKNGDIFSVQNNKEANHDLTEAYHTNIRYLDAFSKLVGRRIEKKLTKGGFEGGYDIKIGIIKEIDEINLQLNGGAVRYLLTNNKKIDVRGPMFVNVECELKDITEKKD